MGGDAVAATNCCGLPISGDEKGTTVDGDLPIDARPASNGGRVCLLSLFSTNRLLERSEDALAGARISLRGGRVNAK